MKKTYQIELNEEWSQAVEELLAKIKRRNPHATQTEAGMVQTLFKFGMEIVCRDEGIVHPYYRKGA